MEGVSMAVENPTMDEIKDILKTKKRIAVVGLSANPSRTSYQVTEVMLKAGYEIIPVNPTVDKVLGIPAVPSLLDIEGHVDIVNVFRRSEQLLEVAEDTVKIGADVFWAQLGLWNEDAYKLLKENGITSIMDRCIKVDYQMMK
jgi:predicted CoA-binding protein